jgi:hypothetical protein
MTITDINNPVNAESIAAFLAAEHKRLGLGPLTQIGVTLSASDGARYTIYGYHEDPINFVNEIDADLDAAARRYRAATDRNAVAAKLRGEAAELVKQAAKVEGLQ